MDFVMRQKLQISPTVRSSGGWRGGTVLREDNLIGLTYISLLDNSLPDNR